MNKRSNIKDLARRAMLTLLLALVTTAAAWAQNIPTGDLEYWSGGHGSILLQGWCEDPDEPTTPLVVAVIVKDANDNIVDGYPIGLLANLPHKGEDNQWHYNGFDDYVPINTAGDYKIEVVFQDVTGDNSKGISLKNSIHVNAPYTVTYNANGGSDAPAQQLKSENIELSLTSTVPTRNGHNFLYWTTASNGSGTRYSPGDTYTDNANMTLYAQWVASDFPGSGTAADPYVISTTSQWNLFADNVNNGNTYSGKYFALGADITISTMVGTNDYPFGGTFNGNGHTMKLAINGTGTGGGHPNIAVAPFRYVNGATFKNLNLWGTVERNDYPNDANVSLGGLIGVVTQYRTATIISCNSDVVFKYNFTWDNNTWTTGHMGGFIGWSDGDVTFTDCLSHCILTGRPNHVGGFVGWYCWGSMTLNNCLARCSGVNLSGSAGSKGTFCGIQNQNPTLNNCYYTTQIGTAQGTATSATGETLRALLGNNWMVNSENQVVPGVMTTLTTNADNRTAIAVAAGAGTVYDKVTLDGYTLHRDGTWNTIVLPFNLTSLTGTPLAGATVKTLASSNFNTQNDGTLTMNFTDATSIEAGKPYIVKHDADLYIRSEADWNTFAANVANGTNDYNGKVVMLAADISVSTMAGADNYNFFRGTFDGCGHTLTINLTGGYAGTAPFRRIENATIKNLNVEGTIITNSGMAGSIAFVTNGITHITNCLSTVTIIGNNSGTDGGLVSCNNNELYFTNCAFKGKLLGSDEGFGGFVGWNNIKVVYNSCLFAPSEVTMRTNGSSTFTRGASSSTSEFNRCFYTQLFGTDQGTSTSATGEALRTLLGDGWEVSGNNVVPKISPVVENPAFTGISLSNTTSNVSTTYASFIGSYAPFSNNGYLYDDYNPNHYAMHAALSVFSPSKTGYTFGGWYSDTAREHAVTTIPFGAAGNMAIYAKWTPNNYSISYNLGGGTVATPNPTTYTIESDAITLTNPTRTGYTFAGWTGTDLSEATMEVTIPTGSMGNRSYTATWTPITYTVRFHKNDGGEDVYKDQTFTYNVAQALTANTFTRDGYAFLGWSTTTDGTVAYTNGQSVSNLANEQDAVVNLYSCWAEIYTISYDLMGGTVATANPTSYIVESATFTLVNPTRTGYTFAGWIGTGLDGATMTVTIAKGSTGNRSYTATWTPITYTITYDLAGGSVATANPATYAINSDAITLVNPTRDGYIFAGWTGTGLTEPTMTVIIPAGSMGNRSYTATWEKRQLELANNSDNGDKIDLASGNGMYYDVTLTDRTIYRNGDWNTLCLPFSLDNFTGTPLQGATVKTLVSTNFADGTLTMNFSNDLTSLEAGKPYIMKWTEEAIAEMDADLFIRSAADWNTFANNVNNGTESYEGKVVKLAANITVSTMVGSGSSSDYGAARKFCGTFDGCGHTLNVSISANQNGVAPFRFVAGATFKNLTISGSVTNNSSGKETAGMIAYICGQTTLSNCIVSASVTCEKSGDCSNGGFVARIQSGEVTINNCLFSGKLLGSSTHSGGFVGWRNASNTPLTFNNCLFNPDEITMGASNSCTFTRTANSSSKFNNCYYKKYFGTTQGNYYASTGTDLKNRLGDGWEVRSDNEVVPKMVNTTTDLMNPVFTNVTISNTTANVETNYADFIGSYTPILPFLGGGGGGHALLLDAHNPDGDAMHAALSINEPTRDGYTFGGWYTNAGTTTPVTTIPFATDGSVNLYAKWVPNTYTIRFHKNDGGEDLYTEQTFTYDEAQELTANSFDRTGYTFDGWTTNANGTGTNYTDGQSVSNLTATNNGVYNLYAKWNPITYTVRFHKNDGGEDEYTEQTFTYDVAQALTTSAFTRTGYTFVGWTTNDDGTGTIYTDRQSVGNLTVTDGETIHLYAKWTPITYTVRFHKNYGGDDEYTDQEFTYDATQALATNAFTRTDYYLTGWAETPDGSVVFTDGESVVNLVTEQGTVVHLYAQWTKSCILFAEGKANQWMTWCDDDVWSVGTTDIKVYTVSSISGSTVILTEDTSGAIPANTPVLIQRTDNSTTAITVLLSAEGTVGSGIVASEGTGCTLYGNPTDATITVGGDLQSPTPYIAGQSYVLYGDKFMLVDTNDGIAAHRCMLTLAAPATARSLNIVIAGDFSSIENGTLKMEDETSTWYDLSGRKLNSVEAGSVPAHLRKGIYIYNGKKTVIK